MGKKKFIFLFLVCFFFVSLVSASQCTSSGYTQLLDTQFCRGDPIFLDTPIGYWCCDGVLTDGYSIEEEDRVVYECPFNYPVYNSYLDLCIKSSYDIYQKCFTSDGWWFCDKGNVAHCNVQTLFQNNMVCCPVDYPIWNEEKQRCFSSMPLSCQGGRAWYCMDDVNPANCFCYDFLGCIKGATQWNEFPYGNDCWCDKLVKLSASECSSSDDPRSSMVPDVNFPDYVVDYVVDEEDIEEDVDDFIFLSFWDKIVQFFRSLFSIFSTGDLVGNNRGSSGGSSK